MWGKKWYCTKKVFVISINSNFKERLTVCVPTLIRNVQTIVVTITFFDQNVVMEDSVGAGHVPTNVPYPPNSTLFMWTICLCINKCVSVLSLIRSTKAHPGPVVHISDNPMDEGKVKDIPFCQHTCKSVNYIFFFYNYCKKCYFPPFKHGDFPA